MDLITWLDAERGRAGALAEHARVTKAAVSQWKTNGVPVEKMKLVRDFTDGVVTLEEMVPESPPPVAESDFGKAAEEAA